MSSVVCIPVCCRLATCNCRLQGLVGRFKAVIANQSLLGQLGHVVGQLQGGGATFEQPVNQLLGL